MSVSSICQCFLPSEGGMDSGDQRGLPGQDEEAMCTSASEGLEEGEVEGETLLIVESEDQASVDLSHDQSADSLNSDVGEDGEGSWNEDMSFYCDKCHKWIPSGEGTVRCLCLKGTAGPWIVAA